jgi:hypothetical protein
MTSAPRTYFDSLDEALAAWGPLSSSNKRHLESIVQLLVEHVGPLHSIYVGQHDTAIGMSLGTSSRVALYLHGNRIDVAPAVVDALGGQAALARLYPGFIQAPGQRWRYARFELSG